MAKLGGGEDRDRAAEAAPKGSSEGADQQRRQSPSSPSIPSPRGFNRREKRGWSPERSRKSRAAQGCRTPPHAAPASRRSSALPKMAAPVAAARPALPARKMAASGRGGPGPRVTLCSANGGRGREARPGSCFFRFFFFFLPGRV